MSWSARLAADELGLEGMQMAVVVGPTASGKSSLALSIAERLDGEIVGADSVQVYRHFDIGSCKPSVEDRKRVPHHLVDVVEPASAMDAASYAARAEAAIADVIGRGKLPIVCGGTYLWVRALLYGLAKAPPGDPEIRARHTAWAEAEGRSALHARLSEVDPASATRLSPNDFVRVSRALEVFEMTAKPLSVWQAEHGFREPRFRAKLLGVRWSPEDLQKRIALRTELSLQAGWIDEVEKLVLLGFRQTRAMKSVGYRQILAFLDGQLPESELSTSIDRATKIFARRQRTWLRDEPVTWLDP